ncbi:hypothetical protein DBR42_14865 [Pelomonas sp. HMWF004]|nr:hypothetical protein DBR42_14865 [Pelomonas sp. HMWF004]
MNALQALFDTQAAGISSPQLALVFEAYAGYDNTNDFNSLALLRPYQAFMRRFSQEVSWGAAGEHKGGWRKVTPARLNELQQWFDNSKTRLHDAGMALFRGGTKDAAEAPLFSFAAYPRDALPSIKCRITLSLTDAHLSQAGVLLREFFEGEYPLAAANVGLGLAHDELSGASYRLEPYFGYWAMRHPGLMSSCTGAQWPLIRAGGLHDVNWITVLGPRLCQRAGGLDGLRNVFGSQRRIACEGFGGAGVLIKAGDLPQLGDTTKGDSVELYRQVGHALIKLREGINASFQVVHGMDREPEKRATWGNRFFSGSEAR